MQLGIGLVEPTGKKVESPEARVDRGDIHAGLLHAGGEKISDSQRALQEIFGDRAATHFARDSSVEHEVAGVLLQAPSIFVGLKRGPRARAEDGAERGPGDAVKLPVVNSHQCVGTLVLLLIDQA